MTIYINPLNHTKDNDIIVHKNVCSIRTVDGVMLIDFNFDESAKVCPPCQHVALASIHDYLIQG